MNKFLYKICGVVLLLLLTAGLAACNGNGSSGNGDDNGNDTDVTTQQSPTPTSTPAAIPGGTTGTTELTLDELGATIIAAGNFWEEWWQLSGRFADLDDAYFTSLEDVRQYLLQTHTDAWVDALFSNEFVVFAEFDGVLHVDGTRAGFSRPRWDDATFEMIEQSGNRAVVEATFLFGSWHRGEEFAYPGRAIYRFVLINGRLDNGLGPWVHSEDMVIEALPPTISQLGRAIESHMRFWDRFWDFEWLTWMHLDRDGEIVLVDDEVYMAVLPESGMEGIGDIRNQLHWMYTDAQIERLLADDHAPFREFDGVLHMNITRMFTYRPDWQTASHVMIEQDSDGRRTVVETTVTMVHTGYMTTHTAVMRFVFENSLIDEIVR